MPVIFSYFGIVIRFYSNEHAPIHVHAVFGDAVIKVVFHIKDGEIYRITYRKDSAAKFPPAKLRQLKAFVSVYKYKILQAWVDYFIMHSPVQRVDINRKLKHEDSFN